jgi:hypothetical protein
MMDADSNEDVDSMVEHHFTSTSSHVEPIIEQSKLNLVDFLTFPNLRSQLNDVIHSLLDRFW